MADVDSEREELVHRLERHVAEDARLGRELVGPLDDGDAFAVEHLLQTQVHEL